MTRACQHEICQLENCMPLEIKARLDQTVSQWIAEVSDQICIYSTDFTRMKLRSALLANQMSQKPAHISAPRQVPLPLSTAPSKPWICEQMDSHQPFSCQSRCSAGQPQRAHLWGAPSGQHFCSYASAQHFIATADTRLSLWKSGLNLTNSMSVVLCPLQNYQFKSASTMS